MNEKRYFVIGDVHGSAKRIKNFVKYTYNLDKTDNILIQLGDFGANYFFNYRDENFKKELGKYPFTYFIIRGNHEERPTNIFSVDTWHLEEFEHGVVWVENDFPYIKYAADYPSVYFLNDTWTTLTFPGAYSVDKYYRLENGYSWFPDEQMDENEMEVGRELVKEANRVFDKVDLVLSHTCPMMYQPTDLFLDVIDQSNVDNTMERYLGEIEYKLNYETWLFGHFHQTRIYPKYEGRQMMMLFDDYVLDLNKYMQEKKAYESLMSTFKNDGGFIYDMNKER